MSIETPATPVQMLPVHVAAERQLHCLVIEARSDPLMLARILQKIAVPEIETRSVAHDATGPASRTEVCIWCTTARASLSAEKLRKLVGVFRVDVGRHLV